MKSVPQLAGQLPTQPLAWGPFQKNATCRLDDIKDQVKCPGEACAVSVAKSSARC